MVGRCVHAFMAPQLGNASVHFECIEFPRAEIDIARCVSQAFKSNFLHRSGTGRQTYAFYVSSLYIIIIFGLPESEPESEPERERERESESHRDER